MKKKIYFLPVIATMIFIFLFSSQQSDTSSELSGSIVLFILKILSNTIAFFKVDIDLLHAIIRKSAHFTIYFVLGFFTINAFIKNDIYLKKAIIWTLIFCVAYAVSDEIHQLFVIGRVGQLKDVLIDSTGSSLAIFIYSVIYLKSNDIRKISVFDKETDENI